MTLVSVENLCVGYQTKNDSVTFLQEGELSSSQHFAFMQYGKALPEGPVRINALPW